MSKKKHVKPFNKRNFLNLEGKESNALISTLVTADVDDANWKYQITIADCNDNVELHGSLGNKNSRKNALHKVDTLISNLSKLRDHLVSEFEKKGLKY